MSDWDLGDEELTRLNMTIGGHPWGIPCAASPSYYPQNATLHSTIVTGPEERSGSHGTKLCASMPWAMSSNDAGKRTPCDQRTVSALASPTA